MSAAMLNGWTVPLNKKVLLCPTVLTAALILSYVMKYGGVSESKGITQQDKSTGSLCAGHARQRHILKQSVLGSAVLRPLMLQRQTHEPNKGNHQRERERSDTAPGSKWVLKRH